MQKNNDTGSILLWSIGISLILVSLFASFSTRLSEKIRFEKSLGDTIQNIFSQDSLVESTGSDSTFHFKKMIQNSFVLSQGQATEFRYTATTAFPLRITIQKGGPLFFSFAAFSGSTFFGGITASGVIDSSISFTGNVSTQYDQGILYIKNLGGYTSFYLTGGIIPLQSFQQYKSTKNIGGDEKTQKIIQNTQFVPGDWGEIDYSKLNMDF